MSYPSTLIQTTVGTFALHVHGDSLRAMLPDLPVEGSFRKERGTATINGVVYSSASFDAKIYEDSEGKFVPLREYYHHSDDRYHVGHSVYLSRQDMKSVSDAAKQKFIKVMTTAIQQFMATDEGMAMRDEAIREREHQNINRAMGVLAQAREEVAKAERELAEVCKIAASFGVNA